MGRREARQTDAKMAAFKDSPSDTLEAGDREDDLRSILKQVFINVYAHDQLMKNDE